MKRYRLLVAPIVQQQIQEHIRFIAQDSIDNALAWEVRLRKAIQGLALLPACPQDEDASARSGYTLFKFVFEGTYLVHSAKDEMTGVIRIVNFRHGARLPAKMEP